MLRRVACWALAFAVLLAGCASRSEEEPTSSARAAASAPRVMDWSPGNWWSYHATVGNRSVDVALIVHERTPDGFRLGTNLSVGFFGLPFNGNVTADLNPRIGPEVWPLFAFPLADGKEWAYELFGYQAKTTAREATIDVATLGARPGYVLESTSFGQVFARYEYAADAGWFTRLQLIEPTDGSTVLLAELTSFGTDWNAAYYVEEVIRDVRIEYPALPSAFDIPLAAGYLQARATLTTRATSGALFATLLDEDGRVLARAESLVRGTDIDRASARTAGGATWRIEHRGAGVGAIFLEITGVSATGPLALNAPAGASGSSAKPAAAPTSDGATFDLPALLQSTLPARPQLGHTTSVAPPLTLGVYAIGVAH